MVDLPAHVRSAWGAVQTADRAQPIASGLSSSRVWKIQAGDASFALKANPSTTIRLERVEQLHAFQKLLSRSCSFVPQLQKTHTGETYVQTDGYFWELSTWCDGAPVEPLSASADHGCAAVTALAQLHRVSLDHSSCNMPIPAIMDRIELVHRYQKSRSLLSQSNLAKSFLGDQPLVKQLASQTIHYFLRDSESISQQLNNHQTTSQIFFVLRDIHREHMLFSRSQVTGVIDFGAARLDHPVVDLVRLLGSMFPQSSTVRHGLLEQYCHLTNYSIPLSLYQTLDHASTLLSSMQWLQWLIVERKQFAVPMPNLLARWAAILHRLELNDW